MSSHTAHADVMYAGLDPECPRCIEHAEHPLASLDQANLRRLADGIWLSSLDRIAAEHLGMDRP